MGKAPDTTLGKMYQEHIGFVKAKNVEGLLNQYAEDCLLISTLTDDRQPIYIRGHKELEEFFRSRIFSLEDLSVDLTQWAEDKDRLMIVEEIATTGTDGSEGTVRFYDNWFLKDGKIKIHFAGTVRYPDGTFADGTGFAAGQEPAKSEPPTDTPMGKLYHEHIAFIKEKNVEGILKQYHPNALLIGTLTEGRVPHFVRGRDELRPFFEGNFMGLKALTTKIDQWAETENTLMMTESITITTMDDQNIDLSFYDNWVLEDGMILTHYAGVVRYPDGSYA
jgi:ketosteroid isomerase-like protein